MKSQIELAKEKGIEVGDSYLMFMKNLILIILVILSLVNAVLSYFHSSDRLTACLCFASFGWCLGWVGRSIIYRSQSKSN